VALCPQGAVEGLEFFTADFQPKETTKLTTMNEDLRKLLTTLFETPADADEATILSAGQSFAEKIAKIINPPKTEAGADKADKVELTALASGLDELRKQFDASTRSNILSAALRDGKLVPNSAKDLPLDKLTSLVAELPANQVPLDKRTPDAVKSEGLDALSAEDLEVARQLGLDPKEMLTK
jgi:phage I-like protein